MYWIVYNMLTSITIYAHKLSIEKIVDKSIFINENQRYLFVIHQMYETDDISNMRSGFPVCDVLDGGSTQRDSHHSSLRLPGCFCAIVS